MLKALWMVLCSFNLMTSILAVRSSLKMQKSYVKESTDLALANRRPNAISFINEVAAACNEDNKEEERNKNSNDASGGTRGSDLA